MVIKSVAFQGRLYKNCLRITVDEQYCPIRRGHWRFRLDSLFVTVGSFTRRVKFAVGCTLLESQQTIFGALVLANTPLHIFDFLGSDTTVSLLSPMTTEWMEFNQGSQTFEISFTPISEHQGTEQQIYDYFVFGIMLFECLG